MRKMARCSQDFDWENVGQMHIQNLSETELRGMLESVAWRKVREMERRTGEETEVVNYSDHHHGMWRRVAMCWDKDEEREETDS